MKRRRRESARRDREGKPSFFGLFEGKRRLVRVETTGKKGF